MEKIKDIIPQVLSDLSQRNPVRPTQIQHIWQESIDEKTRKHVSIGGFEQGKLLVLVDSPTWLFQLSLQKNKILSKMRQQSPDIQSIQFKIGTVK